MIKKMVLREKLGQLIMLDFRYWGRDSLGNYIPFTKMNPIIASIISDYCLGGIALFRENTGSPKQIVELVESMQSLLKIPLLLGIDQEGGLVTRLQTGTDMPGNMILGAAGNLQLTTDVAAAIGKELNSLGINLNFAPTIDVNSSPFNPIIGVRSFGSSPDLVATMGKAYLEGLESSNIISCIKHFPGHGNTINDTHFEMATVNYSYNELKEIDLKPFKEIIENGVDTVMVAHVIVPALDDSKQISNIDGREIGIPATLSEKIITGVLRNELKFDGLVLTDALDMKAISDNFGAEDATVKTILAGSDMAVMPIRIREEKDIYKIKKLFVVLEEEYHKNPLFKKRVEESVKRVISLKNSKNIFSIEKNKENIGERVHKAEKIVGCDEHRDLEKKASALGITLIKNCDELLPFRIRKKMKILILDSNMIRIDILKNSLIKNYYYKDLNIDGMLIEPVKRLDCKLKEKVLNSDFIILLTYNLNPKTTLPEDISSFVNINNKKLVTISCRNPYDIAFMPSCRVNLVIYGAVGFDQTNAMQAPLSINLKTVAEMLFYDDKRSVLLKPVGKLPVTIVDPDNNEILYEPGYGLEYAEGSYDLDV